MSHKEAAIQIIRLKNGDVVKGQIISMLDNNFIVRDPEKPVGNNRSEVPIYDVEFVFHEKVKE